MIYRPTIDYIDAAFDMADLALTQEGQVNAYQLVGVGIIIAVFVGLFIVTAWIVGLRYATIAWIVSLGSIMLLNLGLWLASGGM